MRKEFIPWIGAAAACLIATFPLEANTIVTEPFSYYTSQTHMISISGLTDGSFVGSIQDANLKVSFSSSMDRLTVGSTWATWNSPPATESSLPAVLYSNGATGLFMTLSSPTPVSVFGFELQPDLSNSEPVTVTFLGTGSPFAISLNPDGNAGALLFAVSTDTPITGVSVVDGAGDDFAIANVRYASAPLVVTAEPSTLPMLALGFAVFGAWIVRQRRKRALP
jgi:hypothetical protein